MCKELPQLSAMNGRKMYDSHDVQMQCFNKEVEINTYVYVVKHTCMYIVIKMELAMLEIYGWAVSTDLSVFKKMGRRGLSVYWSSICIEII